MSGSVTTYMPGGGWSVTPAPQAPQTYDQWGRPTGGSAGLGNLYTAVTNAMAQQQPGTPNMLGIGSSGYDQWGRQVPQQSGAVAPQATDWSVAGQLARLPPTGPVAAGDPNDPYGISAWALQQALASRGWGLLGRAAEGSGGGYQGGISGGSTGALGVGGPPGGSGNAAVDAAASASASAAAEEERAMGGLY